MIDHLIQAYVGEDGCQINALPVAVVNDTAGSLAEDATVTSVPAAISDTQLLAANASRRGATIYNDSTANLYVKLGTGASTTSFTLLMVGQSYFEVPFGYSGPVHGIWSAATGDARVTEVV